MSTKTSCEGVLGGTVSFSADAGQSGIRIGRKWLVAEVPRGVISSSVYRIEQGYLSMSAIGVEMRVRRKIDVSNNKLRGHFLTITRANGTAPTEVTIDISEAQFDMLWPATEGNQLEKLSLRIRHGDHTIKLAVFCGELHGLLLAEVDFSSESEAQSFSPPQWFGREVTGAPDYRDRVLASPEGGRGFSPECAVSTL